MRNLLVAVLFVGTLSLNACAICSPKEEVADTEVSKGQERGRLTETTAEAPAKREFKTRHGVSSLIRQRLQNK